MPDRDFTSVARRVVEQAIGERLDGSPLPEPEPDTRNQAALALSKLGASKGGKARAKLLSKTRRKEIAKAGARARWRKSKRPFQEIVDGIKAGGGKVDSYSSAINLAKGSRPKQSLEDAY